MLSCGGSLQQDAARHQKMLSARRMRDAGAPEAEVQVSIMVDNLPQALHLAGLD